MSDDKEKMRRGGFTLLELLMVVIIIAILAAVALPQYLKLAERARMSEALSLLGELRTSELRYFPENSTYTKVFGELDLDPTLAGEMAGTTKFAYSFPFVNATTFVVAATRGPAPPVTAPCIAGYTLRQNRNGNVCGRACTDALLTCP